VFGKQYYFDFISRAFVYCMCCVQCLSGRLFYYTQLWTVISCCEIQMVCGIVIVRTVIQFLPPLYNDYKIEIL